MIDLIGYGWRIVATGLSFFMFGLGGLLLWLLVFPLLALLVRKREVQGRWARAIIQTSFAGFIGLMHWLGVLTYDIRGAERLRRRGLLVLANHPTLIDVVFLVSLIPDADCVVKSKLLRNPFTRGAVLASGYICNDGGADLIAAGIASVRSGKNLIVFPEGSRTPSTGQRPLQRGAANIAVRGGLDITPVVIQCRPPTLAKGQKWYRVPPRRFHMSIHVGEDLAVAPFLAGTTAVMAARKLTHHLSNFFDRERANANA